MIINYLDEILDNIIDTAFEYFFTHPKLTLKKNQEILVVIEELNIKLQIKKRINSFLSAHNVDLKNAQTLEKLYIIYNKYLYSYMLIFIGIQHYSKRESEFISLVIFTQNNYLEKYLNSSINSNIFLLKKIAIQLKTIINYKPEKLKILPEKEFADSLKILKELSDDIKEVLSQDDALSIHAIIKILLYKIIYLKSDKWFISELFENDVLQGEYKFIDVVIGDTSVVDNISLKRVLEDINIESQDTFLEMIKNHNESKQMLTIIDKLDFLFNNKFMIPITDEFVRYHTLNETKHRDDNVDNALKDNMKTKNILKKVQLAKDKDILEKNHFWYQPKRELNAISFNFLDEMKILYKVLDDYNRIKVNVQNKNIYDDLLSTSNQHYYEFNSSNFAYTTNSQLISFRKINFERPKIKLDFRNIRKGEEIHIYGYILTNRFSKIYLNDYKFKGKSFKLNRDTEYDITGKKDIFEFFLVSETDLDENIEKMYEIIINSLFEYSKKNINIRKYHNLLPFFYLNEINKLMIKQLSNPEPKNFQEKTIDLTQLIDLPIVKINKKEIKRYLISVTAPVIDLQMLAEIAKKNIRCQHFVTLDYILTHRKSPDFNFSQAIFEFSKKYAVLNIDELLVCKSCETQLDIFKYISSGTVDLYSGDYIVTGVIGNTSLLDIKEYEIYRQIILQLDKLLGDKIAKVTGLTYLTGSEIKIVRQRESILKDILDLLINHNNNLKNYIIVSNKLRGEQKESIYKREDYSIDESFTFLFTFTLDNSILLRSSSDTDKYKLLKINNIIVYIMLVCILDLSESNIMNLLHNHKLCNWKLYEKNTSFFSKIKIIENKDGDKTSLDNFPVLTYLLTFFACMFYEYNIYQENNEELVKNKSLGIKMLIVTAIDLLNTILLININPTIQEKHFIYQIICSRYFLKVNQLFKNDKILDRIRALTVSDVKVEEKKKYETSKHSFLLETFKTYNFSFFNKSSIEFVKIKYRTLYKSKKTPIVTTTDEIISKVVLPKQDKLRLPHAEFNNVSFKNPEYFTALDGNKNSITELIEKIGNKLEFAVIYHDYMGLKLASPLRLPWTEFKFIQYDSQFKAPVVYYNATNKIKAYYHSKYLNYLGYRESNNKETIFEGTNVFLKKDLGLANKLKYLGFSRLKFNIMYDVARKLQQHDPLASIDDIIKLLVSKQNVKSDEFKKAVAECIQEIYLERIINIKTSLNNISVALNRLSNTYIKSKHLITDDEYNPISDSDILVEEFIKKNKKIYVKKFLEKAPFLKNNTMLIPPENDTFVYTADMLCTDDGFDSKLVYYLCHELLGIINNNKSSSDSMKFSLNTFIYNIIDKEFNYHIYDYNSINMYFDKVLVSKNLATAFDKKIEELTLTHTLVEEEGEELDGENNTEELINDIDQEEKGFDVTEDE